MNLEPKENQDTPSFRTFKTSMSQESPLRWVQEKIIIIMFRGIPSLFLLSILVFLAQCLRPFESFSVVGLTKEVYAFETIHALFFSCTWQQQMKQLERAVRVYFIKPELMRDSKWDMGKLFQMTPSTFCHIPFLDNFCATWYWICLDDVMILFIQTWWWCSFQYCTLFIFSARCLEGKNGLFLVACQGILFRHMWGFHVRQIQSTRRVIEKFVWCKYHKNAL